MKRYQYAVNERMKSAIKFLNKFSGEGSAFYFAIKPPLTTTLI